MKNARPPAQTLTTARAWVFGIKNFLLLERLARRDAFIVLDTDTTSISVQWPPGQVSAWIWTKTWQWHAGPV